MVRGRPRRAATLEGSTLDVGRSHVQETPTGVALAWVSMLWAVVPDDGEAGRSRGGARGPVGAEARELREELLLRAQAEYTRSSNGLAMKGVGEGETAGVGEGQTLFWVRLPRLHAHESGCGSLVSATERHQPSQTPQTRSLLPDHHHSTRRATSDLPTPCRRPWLGHLHLDSSRCTDPADRVNSIPTSFGTAPSSPWRAGSGPPPTARSTSRLSAQHLQACMLALQLLFRPPSY